MGSIYEMSSLDKLEQARIALARAGIVASHTRRGIDAEGPCLGVRHNDLQAEHVRRIVREVDGAAVKR